MNNDSKISPLGICFLSTFLYRSFYIIGAFNLIIAISKSDSIFSVLVGSVIGLILLCSYFYLDNRLPNDNIFHKISQSFPKILAILIIALLMIIVFFIGSFTLYNISLFINYNLLNDIHMLPISILFILTAVYLSSKGINTIVRTSGILIFIFALFTIISIIALINYSDPMNIFPLLTNSFFQIYEGSIYHIILSVSPIFLLLVIPQNKIENHHKYHKYMMITYIVNAIYLFIHFVLIISILGIKLTSILNYSDIIVLQKVSLLNFIERIEDILSFKFMFDGFLFISLSIFYINEGIIHLFQITPNKKIILAIGIFMLVLSMYLHISNIKIVLYLMTTLLTIHFLLILFIKRKKV